MRVLAAESSNFLVPNATIFVEFGLFLVILFVFSRFIVPPLSKAMSDREQMNRKAAEDRDEATRKLYEANERYQATLADARREAAAIRDEARLEAQQIRDEMKAATDAEVARIQAEGERQLALQRDQVVAQLHGEIGGLSTQLAQRILGTTDGPQAATVEQFLAAERSAGGASIGTERSSRTGGGA